MTKWAAYTTREGIRSAVVVGDQAYPYPGNETVNELLAEGILAPAAERALGSGSIDLRELELVAPVQPAVLRDSFCFHEHVVNSLGPDIDPLHFQFPAFYFSNAEAVIGPFADVPIAPGSEQFDYELEIGIVIGRAAHNVPVEEAESYVAGYTIYIDWSARDVQFTEMAVGIGPAKGKDTANTLGPFLVTADEFEPLRKGKGFDIGMRASVNGREITHGNWSTINWSVADIVAYTSRGTVLRPGDVIGTGTVGRGCLWEHYHQNLPEFERWLEPGDLVEMSVDLIGATRQTIVGAETLYPLSSGW